MTVALISMKGLYESGLLVELISRAASRSRMYRDIYLSRLRCWICSYWMYPIADAGSNRQRHQARRQRMDIQPREQISGDSR